MSRGDSVKIWPRFGAPMEDLIDHIKPDIRKNPGIVVIHVGTSDKSLCHFTIIATYYTFILHIIQLLQHSEKGKSTDMSSKRS